jgi:hypothetical protein
VYCLVNYFGQLNFFGRGGARPGCGRKAGVKNRRVRLPEWLLVALEEIGEPSHCIVKACIDQYGIDHPPKKESHD